MKGTTKLITAHRSNLIKITSSLVLKIMLFVVVSAAVIVYFIDLPATYSYFYDWARSISYTINL